MNKIEIPRKLKGKELTNFLVEKLDELADDICQSEEELLAFVKKWNGGFYNYSMNNILLATIQRPNFTLLAGFNEWRKRGRYVKRGERSIRILAPMVKKIKEKNGDETSIIRGFKTVSIFDLEQTEGKELEELGCPELVSGDFDFETIVKACPVPVLIRHLGVSNGNTDGNTIKIAPKKNEISQISTCIHEWAHIALGHCEGSSTLYETEDMSVKEIEAESCNFLVCEFLKIQNNKSRLYIGNWGGNKEELQGRGKTILSVSEKIIKAICQEIS